MPISMGKGTRLAYTTTSGVHLTMEKAHHVVMDSASVGCPPGCPDYYRHDVYYAVRISDSGEYEHSAPWSVGDQGSHNVSHGCINMGPKRRPVVLPPDAAGRRRRGHRHAAAAGAGQRLGLLAAHVAGMAERQRDEDGARARGSARLRCHWPPRQAVTGH